MTVHESISPKLKGMESICMWKDISNPGNSLQILQSWGEPAVRLPLLFHPRVSKKLAGSGPEHRDRRDNSLRSRLAFPEKRAPRFIIVPANYNNEYQVFLDR
jgi:hypothetical protein